DKPLARRKLVHDLIDHARKARPLVGLTGFLLWIVVGRRQPFQRRYPAFVRSMLEAHIAGHEQRQELGGALLREPTQLRQYGWIFLVRLAVDAQRAAFAFGRTESHDAVRSSDVLPDLSANPVGRIRRQAAAAIRVEAVGSLEKTDISFLDDVLHGQA